MKVLNHKLRTLGNTVGDPSSVEKFKKRSVELHEKLQAAGEQISTLKEQNSSLSSKLDAELSNSDALRRRGEEF